MDFIFVFSNKAINSEINSIYKTKPKLSNISELNPKLLSSYLMENTHIYHNFWKWYQITVNITQFFSIPKRKDPPPPKGVMGRYIPQLCCPPLVAPLKETFYTLAFPLLILCMFAGSIEYTVHAKLNKNKWNKK